MEMALPLSSPKFFKEQTVSNTHKLLQIITQENSVSFYEVRVTLILKLEYLREKKNKRMSKL